MKNKQKIKREKLTERVGKRGGRIKKKREGNKEEDRERKRVFGHGNGQE